MPAQAPDPVAALIAAGDLGGAAALAEARGDLAAAIALCERIWRFDRALALAETTGDHLLCLRLALEARAPARARAHAEAIRTEDEQALRSGAALLEARGHLHEAAALLERATDHGGAAALYQRAGARLEAAAAWERGGHLQEAMHLYALVARGSGDEATIAGAHLRLGRLLGRLGRHREAVRALQAAMRHEPLVIPAGRRLAVELVALGLRFAADDVAARLHRRDSRLPERGDDLAAYELTPGNVASGAPTSAEALPRFQRLRLIGVGAVGRVFAAEDRLLGRTVALKSLSVSARGGAAERQAFQRFLREAEAARRLDHPRIVRLFDVDPDAGLLVFEHLPGGTLGDRLAEARGEGTGLSPALVRRLGLELLGALDAAHAAGVIHRDVKPANVLFDATGGAKLADFGAAHLLDFGGTQTGGFIGTLGYLAPEQVSDAPIGPAADLYALGVTLFEALTGRQPFTGGDIVGQTLGTPPPAPSVLRPALLPAHDEVILRALGKAPEERFGSAAEMALAVARWPDQDPIAQHGAHQGRTESIGPSREGSARPPQAAAPRTRLGRTSRGTLWLAPDPRLPRALWVEELDAPADDRLRADLQRLALAGGPYVQRLLDLSPEGTQVTWEALAGSPTPLCDLAPEERALLEAEAARDLAAAGRPLCDTALVVRTAGGPVVLLVAAEA
jgi:serine/threonine-protein kinase